MGEDAGRQVTVTVDSGSLHGDLTVPGQPRGVVLFAHGSGSSRRSPRNRAVARQLRGRGLATMVTDLLTEAEERADAVDRHLRFDVALLARRLEAVAVRTVAETPRLPLGLFGASTGAAAALVAASRLRDQVRAVVSRGGRPDLAGEALGVVTAPTLLIVGGLDDVVLGLNRRALEELRCEKRLDVVPGATHLFEEQGALAEVSRLAGDWFTNHLGQRGCA